MPSTNEPESRSRVAPPKRKYAEHTGKQKAHTQDLLIRLGPTFILGGIGFMWGLPLGAGLVMGLLGALIGYFVFPFMLDVGSKVLLRGAIEPSGATTPPPRALSVPESKAAQGDYLGAIQAYEALCDERPTDPEPYLRIARIYLDKLNQPADAIAWFKRARSDAAVDAGRYIQITQEVVEIYMRRLDTPLKAIPELAQLIDRYPNDPSIQLAKRQLAELRRKIPSQEA